MDVGLHLGPIFIDFTLQLDGPKAAREPGFSELCWLLEPRCPRALQEGLRDRFWSDFQWFSTVFSMIFGSSWASLAWIFSTMNHDDHNDICVKWTITKHRNHMKHMWTMMNHMKHDAWWIIWTIWTVMIDESYEPWTMMNHMNHMNHVNHVNHDEPYEPYSTMMNHMCHMNHHDHNEAYVPHEP